MKLGVDKRKSVKPKPWTVFVSHAGSDTWVARQIAKHLKAAGAKPFLDEAHITIGEDFEEEILAALDKSGELLVLFDALVSATALRLGRDWGSKH